MALMGKYLFLNACTFVMEYFLVHYHLAFSFSFSAQLYLLFPFINNSIFFSCAGPVDVVDDVTGGLKLL